MYADPAHIRKNRVNLSLNDAEDRLAEAMAEFNGMQKSVFLRELVLEGLTRFHSSKSAAAATEMRATNS
ncbi:hypothetical protein JAO85_13930 [Comamonas sp. NyZ500]|uniref:Ribbon-helix-helix protein CopG domain-containing protein n=1 Tax=Comamonas testosteroni TaxID=285 RepID=A0A096FAY2_COMTE|nr:MULTISPECIES: hypothetical protein [Comamonas]KGH27039.1 hypothetical protein P353_19820 [Comamonas testosteroni]MBL5978384.1 hypothetical protein [Comamonas sp. NyZ500]